MPMRILTVTGTPPDVRLDGRSHDRAEQPTLERQRGSSALAGDLRHRAPEVEVDVVGQILLDDHPHGAADDRRIDAVQLDRPRCSSAPNRIIAMVFGLRSTSALVVIISQT